MLSNAIDPTTRRLMLHSGAGLGGTDPHDSVLFHAPQLLQAGVPTASGAVELVPERVLLVIVLVVLLGRPEFRRGGDLRDDLFLERFVPFEFPQRLVDQATLFLVVIEDGGTVLRSHVAELAVRNRRVDIAPEDVDRFGVAGPPVGAFRIRGVHLLPSGVPRGDRNPPRQFVERVLHAPEATAGERRFREGPPGRYGLRPLGRPRGGQERGEGENRKQERFHGVLQNTFVPIRWHRRAAGYTMVAFHRGVTPGGRPRGGTGAATQGRRSRRRTPGRSGGSPRCQGRRRRGTRPPAERPPTRSARTGTPTPTATGIRGEAPRRTGTSAPWYTARRTPRGGPARPPRGT